MPAGREAFRYASNGDSASSVSIHAIGSSPDEKLEPAIGLEFFARRLGLNGI
jgi:hypothetical protein